VPADPERLPLGGRTRRPALGRARPARRGLSLRPGRGAEHAIRPLAGFSGVLQVDAYAVYNALADPRPRRRSGDACLSGRRACRCCRSGHPRRIYGVSVFL
jgi:hypothetical protein